MSWRVLLLPCATLLLAHPLAAQSASAAADQISGRWTGVLRPNNAPPDRTTPVEIDLESDGRTISAGTVTGPQLTPGDIRSGSFDAGTGRIVFEVSVPGAGAPFVFEGTLIAGTAAGSVQSGTEGGTFLINRAASGGSPAAQPQEGQAAALRHGFDEVNGWVARAAEMVPAERYGYRPVATVRSFGQQIAHIADSYNYYCARAAGRAVEWSDAIEQGVTDKATLVQRLRQAAAVCTAAHESGQAQQLMANIAHTNLHYGNLITYLRMMGLVPPSS